MTLNKMYEDNEEASSGATEIIFCETFFILIFKTSLYMSYINNSNYVRYKQFIRFALNWHNVFFF